MRNERNERNDRNTTNNSYIVTDYELFSLKILYQKV